MAKGRKRKYPLATTIGQKLLADLRKRGDPAACTEENLRRILARPFRSTVGWPDLPLRDVSVAELDVSGRSDAAFARLRVRTIGQLLATRFVDLISQWNFGVVSLSRMEQELYRLLFTSDADQREGLNFSDFASMASSFVRRCLGPERIQSIVIGRLGLSDGRRVPLVVLGSRYGITRERIRQLADGGFEMLGRPAKLRRLNPFWAEVWAALGRPGRVRTVSALAKDLQTRLGWAKTPPVDALARLLSLHGRLRVDSRKRVVIRG